jgi:hypothetical protein
MSIEGLWSVDFGLGGGIAVMETGRVFGGDSWFAYTGDYEVDGNSVTARLRLQRHNPSPSAIDVWASGDNLDDVDVVLSMSGDQWRAKGVMAKAAGSVDRPLAVSIKKLSELPG